MDASPLERLNNAIVKLSYVHGPDSRGWLLAEQWQRQVWQSSLRWSGPAIALLFGRVVGIWGQYRDIVETLPKSMRVRVPEAEDVRPTAADMLDEIERQILDSNLDAYRAAARAAYEAGGVAKAAVWGGFVPVLALVAVILFLKK